MYDTLFMSSQIYMQFHIQVSVNLGIPVQMRTYVFLAYMHIHVLKHIDSSKPQKYWNEIRSSHGC
jgi:hypothetical protein